MNYEKDTSRFDSGYLYRNYEYKGRDTDSIRARFDERLQKAKLKQKQNAAKITKIRKGICW